MKETEPLQTEHMTSILETALDSFQDFEEILILTFTKHLLRFEPTVTREKYGSLAA